MKKYILYLGVVVIFLTGCQDFLVEKNRSDIGADDFYATADGFETAVNAAYSELRNLFGGIPWLYCAGTDMYVEGRDRQPVGLSEYRFLTPSEAEAGVLYQSGFQAVQTCNMALYYSDKTEVTSTLNNRVGEVKALRAYYYFLMVQTYGGVTLVTDFINKPVISYERNSAEDVYKFIIAELEEAMNMVGDGSYTGRVNKRAIQHILAKVYLTRGYESFGSSEDFTNAAGLADAAINNQKLNLTFEELWAPGNENNEEVLFSVQYDATSIATSPATLGGAQAYVFGPYMGGNEVAGKAPWRSYTLCPTKYFFDLFTEDDSRLDVSIMMYIYDNYYDFYNISDLSNTVIDYYYAPSWASTDEQITVWRNEDPAHRANTIVYKYETWEASKSSSNNFMHPAIKKFDDPTSAFGQYSSTRDIIQARLGETYLIAAEAYHKAGDNAKAIERINEVRRRAAKLGADLSISSVDIDVILDERARELAGEYHRWFDLKRTGTLVERTKMYNHDIKAIFDSGVNPFEGNGGALKILRPIPQSALDINQNKDFPQNPGY